MLSRAADSLYWISRYTERAENTARLLDVNMQLMLDFENQTESSMEQHWRPIINTLEVGELFSSHYDVADAKSVTEFVTFETRNPNSILSCLMFARENARSVREQISSEMWEELNKIYLFTRSDDARRLFSSSPYEFFRHLVAACQLFQGITHASMTHGEGWDFMHAGRYLERADSTSRILDMKYHVILPSGESVGGNIDSIQWMAVLKSCSALEAYRKLYAGQVTPWRVAEFLILNDHFPRSICFCVDRLDGILHSISGSQGVHYANEAERLSGQVRSELDFATTSDIFNAGLHQYLDRVQIRLGEINEAISAKYFQTRVV